jgi:hypothetical protein
VSRPNLQGVERLLTIDPGSPHETAYWRNGVLLDVHSAGSFTYVHPSIVHVCEVPHIHKDTKDPQSIVDLAMRIGEDLRGPCRATGAPWIQYLPAQWKGTLKKWSHHRIALAALTPPEVKVLELALKRPIADVQRYVEAACNAHALRNKVTYTRDDHNKLDAVALGLWCLGRI